LKIYVILAVSFLARFFEASGAVGQEAFSETIANWLAPATWSPAGSHGGLTTMGEITSPLPFIGLAPCRIVDTRGNGAPIQGGIFAGGDLRNYTIPPICGVPASVAAVSLNFTVTGPGQTTAGFLVAWPTGGAVPPVSIINWDRPQQRIANAAVVPTNGAGSITVNVSAATHVIIDINGYYGNPTAGLSNVFLGPVAGNTTMTGLRNVGIGTGALQFNTSGSDNTAAGNDALLNNTSGFRNTAFGATALRNNQTQSGNTAVGFQALYNHTAGDSNIAVGNQALYNHIAGQANIAVGAFALFSHPDGVDNVAIGSQALSGLTSGSVNIAIGDLAAGSLQSGSNNIHIGNPALTSESNTIRIGTGGDLTRFFVAAVRGITTGQADGVPVYIDGLAQLGTISSSVRVKREITDVGAESSAILKLRPVSFLYRNDTIGIRQYGLIAEEVAGVMPELVQLSDAGEPEMVRYHFLPPLLLRELQKQQKTIERQNEVIAGLEARLARLEARLPSEPGR